MKVVRIKCATASFIFLFTDPNMYTNFCSDEKPLTRIPRRGVKEFSTRVRADVTQCDVGHAWWEHVVLREGSDTDRYDV